MDGGMEGGCQREAESADDDQQPSEASLFEAFYFPPEAQRLLVFRFPPLGHSSNALLRSEMAAPRAVRRITTLFLLGRKSRRHM